MYIAHTRVYVALHNEDSRGSGGRRGGGGREGGGAGGGGGGVDPPMQYIYAYKAHIRVYVALDKEKLLVIHLGSTCTRIKRIYAYM